MLGAIQPLVWFGLGVFWWSLILTGAGVTLYRSRRKSRGGRGKRRNLVLYAIAVAVLAAAAWFWPFGREWVVTPLFTTAFGLATPLLVPLMILAPGFALVWWSQRKIAQQFPVTTPSSSGPGRARSKVAAPVHGAPRPRTLALVWLATTIAIAATLFLLTRVSFDLDVFGHTYASEGSPRQAGEAGSVRGGKRALDSIPFLGTLLVLASALVSGVLVSLGHAGLRLVRGRA